MVGDFNAHHYMGGGAQRTGVRGREVEAFLLQYELNVMNNGAPSRILYEVESAIDLSLCTPQLEADYMWTVLSLPDDSDHFPIVITYNETKQRESTVRWKRRQTGMYMQKARLGQIYLKSETSPTKT